MRVPAGNEKLSPSASPNPVARQLLLIFDKSTAEVRY